MLSGAPGRCWCPSPSVVLPVWEESQHQYWKHGVRVGCWESQGTLSREPTCIPLHSWRVLYGVSRICAKAGWRGLWHRGFPSETTLELWPQFGFTAALFSGRSMARLPTRWCYLPSQAIATRLREHCMVWDAVLFAENKKLFKKQHSLHLHLYIRPLMVSLDICHMPTGIRLFSEGGESSNDVSVSDCLHLNVLAIVWI